LLSISHKWLIAKLTFFVSIEVVYKLCAILPIRMKNFCFLFFLVALTSTNAQTFPQGSWNYTPSSEMENWDSTKLEEFNRYIIDSTQSTGLLIIHKGKIVYEYGNTSENCYIASCRKSILSILYGKYVCNGKINLDDSLTTLEIDDVSPLLPIEKNATIKDVISARSGVFLNGSNPGDFRSFAPERGTKTPGSYWLYSNWDFNAAGYIFEQESGKDIYKEVEKQLVRPLHMQDWTKSLQKKSGDSTVSQFLAYPMYFSTRDMARIGLLMLNKGKWNNKQIIEESWIAEMTKPRTAWNEVKENVPLLKDSPVELGYGFMWWLWENNNSENFKGAYSALGAFGQSITVFPNIDVVVVLTTNSVYERYNDSNGTLAILKKAGEIFSIK